MGYEGVRARKVGFALDGLRKECNRVGRQVDRDVGDLGVLVVVLGNICWEIIVHLGGNWDDMLKQTGQILAMIEAAANDLHQKNPLFNLTRGMIRYSPSAPPRLRVKAAEARKLLPVALHALTNFLPHRLQCLQALSRVYKEVDNWGDASSQEIGRNCKQFVVLYGRLRDTAAADCFPSVGKLLVRSIY